MSSLLELIDNAPPRSVALNYAGEAIDFGTLAAASARVAGGLAGLGVGAGDRVALWLPNVPAWLVAFFACARLGAIAVSVNTRFRATEVGDIVGRSRARVLVLWPDFHGIDFAGILAAVEPAALAGVEHVVAYGEGATTGAVPTLAGRTGIPWATLATHAPLAIGAARDAARCVVFTTSGTTRAPKFVCHVQGTVAAHAHDVVAALELDAPGTRVLQALPMCGVFGFTQALSALAARAPMDLLPVFDAVAASRLVREHDITHMHGVDDMIAAMLDAVDEAQPFPSLRLFGYAAFNPSLEDIAARAEARGVTLCGLYGMSECHALYAMQPPTLPLAERRKGGGRPLSPRAEVRVRDPASGALLPPGQTGELEVSGPSLLAEYLDDAAATAAALTADGFLRTGDLAYLEEDGRFCYLARMGDVLRLGGFLVSPLEIEAVLDAHPQIGASQVVAIELDGRTRVVAFVTEAHGAGALDEPAVIAWCRARLAAYKVPARVLAIEAFPTTASANGTKIQKARLRAMALERCTAAPS
ncbi:MAG: AMP-binding protein [Gammaproteobacteria bacterium]